jgi:hypothetical protein
VEQVSARTAPLPGRRAPRHAGATSRCSGAHPRSSSRAPLVGAGLAGAPPGHPQTSQSRWRCLQAGPGARRRALLVSPRAHRRTELESLPPWTELVRPVPALPPPMDDDYDEKEELASSRRSYWPCLSTCRR